MAGYCRVGLRPPTMLAPADIPPFTPHPLLRGAHRQTLSTRLPRRGLADFAARAESREFALEDGVRLLARCHWQERREGTPTVLLLHGLAGDAESHYMRGTARTAFRAGFNALRLNSRDSGGTESQSPGIFHSGRSADALAVLRELARRDGLANLYLAGFSLGGNLAVKLAGELGAEAPGLLRGIATVSPALELAACAQVLDGEPACRLYRAYFLRHLKAWARRKAGLFPDHLPLPDLGAIRSLRDFDDRVTAPWGGFEGWRDYYERASAWPHVPRLRVPLLIVHALDDPVVPPVYLERAGVRSAPAAVIATPERGGHCGFLARRRAAPRAPRDGDCHWAEQRVLQFLTALEGDRGGTGSRS